jgi:hypothetical protein
MKEESSSGCSCIKPRMEHASFPPHERCFLHNRGRAVELPHARFARQKHVKTEGRGLQMGQMERIVFWCFLALTVFFGSTFYSVIENVREEVKANAALLEKPRIEASVYPGVPAALRDQWNTAMGEAQADGKLWMTLRVVNRGGSDASGVTARFAIAAPVEGVYAYGADGKAIDSDAASGGKAGAPVEVKLEDLPAEKAALVFVAVSPDGFGAAPYSPETRLRWTEAAPHHWREVEVTGRSGGGGEEGVLAHLYSLGAPLAQS